MWDPDAPPCIASDERPENIFEGGGLAEDRVLAARTHEMQSWTGEWITGSPRREQEGRVLVTEPVGALAIARAAPNCRPLFS